MKFPSFPSSIHPIMYERAQLPGYLSLKNVHRETLLIRGPKQETTDSIEHASLAPFIGPPQERSSRPHALRILGSTFFCILSAFAIADRLTSGGKDSEPNQC